MLIPPRTGKSPNSFRYIVNFYSVISFPSSPTKKFLIEQLFLIMGKKGPTPSWRGLPRSIFYFSFFFHHDSASAIGVAAQATFPFGVWSSITRWSFCTVSGGRPSHVSLAVSFRFFEWRKSVSDFSISHILFLLIRNTFVIAVKPITQVMLVVTLWLLVGFFFLSPSLSPQLFLLSSAFCWQNNFRF